MKNNSLKDYFKQDELNIFKYLRTHYIVDGAPCSIRRLAKELGISHSHISELETGVIKGASIATLHAYHKFFKVPYDVLFGENISKKYVPDKNSFEELIENFGLSKKGEDRDVFSTYLYLGTTGAGLSLLYYISAYINGEISIDELAKAINTWKNIDNKDEKSYQVVRQTIDNSLYASLIHEN